MGTSRTAQVGIYVGKHFRLFINEKGWKVILFAAVIALLVSTVLSSNMFVTDLDTFSGCFALVSACIWIGVFNSIQSICKERGIIKREHRTGLHISSYVISHVIFQAVICAVQSLIILGITALFLRYPQGSALLGSVYLEFFITYYLVTFSADLLGLAISAVVKTPMAAMTVMPFILIVQMIFSGMLFVLVPPLDTLSAVTISKWGLNAVCISADYNELENTQKIQIETALTRAATENELPVSKEFVSQVIDENYPDQDLPQYAHEKSNLMRQWGILLLHALVYFIVSVVSLEFVDRDRR